MKKIHFIFFLFAFLFNATALKAQKAAQKTTQSTPQKNTVAIDKPCYDYACNVQKAKQEIKAKHYENGFIQIKSANSYNNKDAKEIDALYRLLFDAILEDKKTAVLATEKADEQRNRADEQTQIAITAKDVAKTAQETAETQKKRADTSVLKMENALFKTDSVLKIVVKEKEKFKKIREKFYFYGNKYAVARTKKGFFFIDTLGNEITKFGNWAKAEMFKEADSRTNFFDGQGFAKVFNEQNEEYWVDTLGNKLKVARTVNMTAEDYKNINILYIADASNLNSLKDSIYDKMPNLKYLIIRNAAAFKLDAKIKNMSRLEYIEINRLNTEIPLEIGELKNLKHLVLTIKKSDRIANLLKTMEKLPNLCAISITESQRYSILGRKILEEMADKIPNYRKKIQFKGCPYYKFMDLPRINITDTAKLIIYTDIPDSIPAAVNNIKNLEVLDLQDGRMTGNPNFAVYNKLKQLKILKIAQYKHTSKDLGLENLPNLTVLELDTLSFIHNFEKIKNLKKLTSIDMLGTTANVKNWGWLTGMTDLDSIKLDWGKIDSLPDAPIWAKISSLDLSKDTIRHLPKGFYKLKNLKTININWAYLDYLPDAAIWATIKKIDLSNSMLDKIPNILRKTPNIEELDLYNNNLTELPKELFLLPKLTHLYAGKNKIKEIPIEMLQLKELKRLSLYSNKLDSLPAFLLQLPNLKQLDYRKNKVPLSYKKTAQKDLELFITDEKPKKIRDLLVGEEQLDNLWHLQNNGGVNPIWKNPMKKDADAKVLQAWEYMGSLGDKNIKIAVLDDGFDTTHPEFSEPNKIVSPWNFADNNTNVLPQDADDEHGTNCAGLILAAANGRGMVGVAPNAQLMPLRFKYIGDEEIEAYFQYCIDKQADIICCPFGMSNPSFVLSDRMKKAIENATRFGRNGKGAVVLFAAGSEARPTTGFANHPDVITVAASNSSDVFSEDYSNYGKNISICAPSNGGLYDRPGAGITTTILTQFPSTNGEKLYTNDFGGATTAVCIASGVAALILSANPDLRAEEVKQIMEKTADKIGDLSDYEANGHSDKYGYGRINAFEAVKMATEMKVNTLEK
ncbi:MAG: hypothetical protein RI894_1207 [Bacteroidota bacterium]